MHEENLHIRNDQQKGYPQPDIPAEEAWKQMAALLDNAMPVSPPEPPPSAPKPSPSAGEWIFGGSKFWAIVGGVIIIAVALTWSVISLTDRSEEPAKTLETTAQPLQISPSDSLISTKLESITSPGTKRQNENIGYQDEEKNKQETMKEGENPLADVPAQSASGTILIADGDKPAQQRPVNDDAANDTLLIAESQLQPNASDADSVIRPVNPVPGVNPTANPPSDTKQDNAKEQSESGKPGSPPGKSGNLNWQIGINGNIGELFQKGRDPNMFYGVMATGGFWNEKLKGGIETGLGFEVYHDYGSVTENILLDSIPIDTLGNYQHIDTNRITGYKYRYQYLQVPLFVSKQVLTKGKFSLDIKTGPLLGIMISERKTLDYISGPDNGEILGTVNNDYARLKISWQWQLIPQLRWNLSERLSLSLSPYGIFYLNNLYDKKNRPANMPIGFGIYAGLIFRFK